MSDPVNQFSVHLDTAICQPGQLLTGRVSLALTRPLALRNLDLLVQGSCTVGWSQGGGHFVRDDEVYVNDMAELVAATQREVVTLSAGEHLFPFACNLPHHLPATFAGGHGSVAYSVRAVMQAENPTADVGGPWTASGRFAVEAQLPLAGHAALLQPCVVEARMQVSRGSSVKASLSLPRRVFATQEDLLLSATVSNRSRKAITRLSAGLLMDCRYQAGDGGSGGGAETLESLLVAERTDDYRIGHMEGRCWQNIRLRIPRMIPPSGLPHCRLISISYALIFRAELDHCTKDLNLRVPLVIGVGLPESTVELPQLESLEPTSDVGASRTAKTGAAAAAVSSDNDPQPSESMRALSRISAHGSFADSLSVDNDEPGGSTDKLGARPEFEYRVFDPAANDDEASSVPGVVTRRFAPDAHGFGDGANAHGSDYLY